MGLKEVQEELKSKLAEIEKEESLEAVEEKEEIVESKEDTKEEVVEEVKEEPKEEPKKTPAQYAEERRAARAAKQALAEELAIANARIAAMEAERAKEKESQPSGEPDKETDPIAWAEWRVSQTEKKLAPKIEQLDQWREDQLRQAYHEQQKNQALAEVANFENEVRKTNADFDDVKQYYANMLAASVKIVNPKLSNESISKIVSDRMLLRASELLNDGHENPIAVMYQEAKALGYRPKQEKEEEVKPNLEKVAQNRSRNAGTAGASGQGDRGELTPSSAIGMTNAEFAKLKPEQKKALFAQLQG
jgi:hypothetical protein